MSSFLSPHLAQEYFGNASFFHSSYQPGAIRDAIILNVGYLPIYFLALCIFKDPIVFVRYKNTIIFAGIIQYVFTLPYTVLTTWLAIYVNHEVKTTVFVCTFIRMSTSFLSFVSFNALTAISITRLFNIVFNLNLGLAWNVLFFVGSTLPALASIVYVFYASRLTDSFVCGPLLFYYERTPLMLWNGYVFVIPMVAVLLNSITAGYLLYKRFERGTLRLNSSHTVNEQFIAFALLIQSVIPALTMSTKGFRSILEIYGLSAEPWVRNVIDIAGNMTTGLNMVASMVCIKHFRLMFRQLMPFKKHKKTTNVGEVTTVTVRPT